MVEEIVSKFLTEMKATEEEFVRICTNESKNSKHRKDLKTILAATDFGLFKQLMHEENKKLNDYAYSVLQHQQKSKSKLK